MRPSPGLYGSIVVANLAFIALYFMAREFALPLVGHRDPYVFEEYPVKVGEALAAAVVMASLLRPRATLRPAPVAA